MEHRTGEARCAGDPWSHRGHGVREQRGLVVHLAERRRHNPHIALECSFVGIRFRRTASASSDAGSSTGSTELSGSSTSSSTSRFDRAKDTLAAGDYSTFLNLLQLSGLAHEIEERQVTILAPTEDAFKKLTKDQLADLATNPTKIDDILKRHIVDEVLTFDELAAKSSVTTLSGDTLTVSNDGGTVTVNGAVVSEPKSDSVSGEEGQEVSVLGIDTVLLDGQ